MFERFERGTFRLPDSAHSLISLLDTLSPSRNDARDQSHSFSYLQPPAKSSCLWPGLDAYTCGGHSKTLVNPLVTNNDTIPKAEHSISCARFRPNWWIICDEKSPSLICLGILLDFDAVGHRNNSRSWLVSCKDRRTRVAMVMSRGLVWHAFSRLAAR